MATREERIRVSVDGADKGARDLDKLGRAVDDVGDELKDTAKDASVLDKELDRLQRSVNDLNREALRTGDKGILKQIKEAKRELAPLQAVRRELDKIAAAEEKARKDQEAAWLKRMTTPQGGRGLGFGLNLPVSPTTLAIGGIAGTALSLPIGAAAGGALIGGAGLAGVGLGVAGAAANNPAIGRSATAALQEESQRWQRASRAFEEPTLRAIARIKDAVDDVPLEEILENAAEFVEPLAAGLAGFTRAVGEGFGELVEDAGPIIEVLSDELPVLGKSFKSMFEEIGEGSEGGAEALEDILHITERMIIGAGKVIHFLEDAYGAGVKLRQSLPGDVWNDDEAKVVGFGKAIGGAAGEMDRLGDETGDTVDELKNYKDAIDKAFGATANLVDSNVDYQQSLDDLTAKLRENKGAWDIGTQAGRDHIAATRDAIESAYDVRQAMIDSGRSVADADAWFRKSVDSILKQAAAAGASAQVIGTLTERWLNLLSLPATKVLNVRVVESSSARAGTGGARAGTLPFLADGGDFRPGYAVVGEEGPELVRFNGSGHVFNAKETADMMASGGGPDGRTEVVHRLVVETPDGRELLNTILSDGGQRLYASIQRGVRTGQLPLATR